jgi:hypothetical protein
MMRFLVACLMTVSLAACGQPISHLATVPAGRTSVHAASNDIQGAYLSIEVRPTAALSDKARDLRMTLGFLDMSHAIPPRASDAPHLTVAYFQSLSPNSAQILAQRYHGATVPLTVNGWGVVRQQAAYFSVLGLKDWRQNIKALVPETFVSDDPHITFGVHPGKLKDVHGVPKPLQTPLPPIELVGDVHLQHGEVTVW